MLRELGFGVLAVARNLIASDTTIRALKADTAPARLNDGDGLYLLTFVKGGAHGWRFAYSLNGKRNNISLGTYPDTGLGLARAKADEFRALVSQGLDPSQARQASKAEQQRQQAEAKRADKGLAPSGSFEAVAREWLAQVHTAKVSPAHAERTRVRLEQDVFPYIGRQPLADVEPPELLAALRRIIDRGAIETAHRAKDACGQVFRYGIASGQCVRNPAADLRDALPPVPTRHHAAIVDPVKAGELLRAMADYQGNPITRGALALSALLFLRPGELRQIEWAWLDLDGAVLTIPADMMKRTKDAKANGTPHLVPLASQAVAVFQDLQALTGAGRYVFPSLLSDKRPMSENTVRTALRRLGYANEDMTAHGFRAMARTMAAERLGIAPEVIEAQLAHTVGDALGRAYNRTQYLDQRRELMTKWAAYLDRLRTGAQVLPLRPGQAVV
ncbi:MAG: integrase arm-type DNA-binding domain-containing protein [Ideonella sp.]|nr:integrase arm-type DNA-binding domain-containing protein [Ideonella sp.]